MSELRDRELLSLYRGAGAPEPPRRIRDAILAASRRVASPPPRVIHPGVAHRWGERFAIVATVILAFAMTLMVFERESGRETAIGMDGHAGESATAAPADSAVRTDLTEKVPRKAAPEQEPHEVPGRPPVSSVMALVAAQRAVRTPEEWLEDIRGLTARGRKKEAARELADFKKHHPEYSLPKDFR